MYSGKMRKNRLKEIDIIQKRLEEQAELESLLDTDKKPKQKKTNTKKINTQKQYKTEEKKKKKKRRQSNKEFLKVTYLFVGLFLCMMGYLVWFGAVRSKEIINSPYNVRLDSMAERVIRGEIVDKDGNVLAKTNVSKDGTETREYPYGNLYAHVIGYDSNGKAGLESTQNFNLLTSNAFFLEKIANEIKEEKNMGDRVITTLDTKLQQASSDALGSYKGAVVVLEVSTGKVLAMVSKPTFNPNTVSGQWEELINASDSRLLNRATQGAYAPGSTFKIVTTLAYMRQNTAYQNYSYLCESKITEGDVTIHCAGNRKHGEETLKDSLAYSCNASFSNIGLSLNLTQYRKTAEDLLFNKSLPCDLQYRKSNFTVKKGTSKGEVMMTAIGQGNTMTSPYHMALIAASIGNGGILMRPYFVSRIENYTGAKVKSYQPERYAQLMTSQEASVLKEYMQAVVKYGTGTALNTKKYTVAGKTGTAEYSSDKAKSHSWFMGFTNVENPEIALAVVVESADQSGKSAVTVAKKIIDAYY